MLKYLNIKLEKSNLSVKNVFSTLTPPNHFKYLNTSTNKRLRWHMVRATNSYDT